MGIGGNFGAVRRLVVAAACSLVLAAGALGASAGAVGVSAGPEKDRVGDVELIADAAVTPLRLPREEAVPAALSLTAAVRSLSGAQPPPLRELEVEVDRSFRLDTRGLPTTDICSGGVSRPPQSTAEVIAACRDAIVGWGVMTVGIEFPETVVRARSRLVLLNGGTAAKETTFFLHAYLTVPVPAAIVTTLKVRQIRKGPYGLLMVATVPKIASGSGSITDLRLKIDRRFTRAGRTVGVLGLACPRGRFQVRERAFFAAAEAPASLELARPCLPRD